VGKNKNGGQPNPEGQKRVRGILGKKPSNETVRRAARDAQKGSKRKLRDARNEIEQIKKGVVQPHPNSKRRHNE
jgi:hypothetical protein